MQWEALLLGISLGYVGLLFAIARFGDKRADAGRSIISNPYVYTLSIAVYCTAWTFYGSVGRAASTGVSFLPVYLGPTLMAVVWWIVLRKIVRISKVHRITSIPDFIASRYGKSTGLAVLVTCIAVVGIMPYVALQLKAIATSFEILRNYPELSAPQQVQDVAVLADTALYVALLLAVFAILFGTRHIDATERHEGMVAAIAFESLTKLLAFLAVGLFVTFGIFDGFGDLFARAETAGLTALARVEEVPGGYTSWFTMTFLSMAAILFLPRQFQVLVVENVNEDHIRTASWLFPLYLLIINIFVLPIALAGGLVFPANTVNADTYVLSLPIAEGASGLAVLAFIGGLSAATSMVIVASIALATMICNDLVMPALLRIPALRLNERHDLSRLLIAVRRGGILLVVFLGYVYYRVIGDSYALVSIGLMSFAAAVQFAPPILIGIYWKHASRLGVFVGLGAGFSVWIYTLMLPSFVRSGWLPGSFLRDGPFGITLLRPYELFGLQGLDPLTHGVFWSMLVNVGGIVLVSQLGRLSAIERLQGELFVDVYSSAVGRGQQSLWRGTAQVSELFELVARFVGRKHAERDFARYAEDRGIDLERGLEADPGLVHHVERRLAGAIGAASARVMVSSVVKGEVLSMEEVMTILDEASQILDYSHRLEQKSRELEAASAELKAVNQRLQELDRLKDEFVSTVTHELRTPLTSIRAFSEILLAHGDMEIAKRQEFLGIIVKESERLTRLINDVLDFAKMQSGRVDWNMEELDASELVQHAINATSQLFKDRCVELTTDFPEQRQIIIGDCDRLTQVVINLLSNAVKFCDEGSGCVNVGLATDAANQSLAIWVQDNGPGIPSEAQERIFEQFHQVSEKQVGKPKGTGLGLAISRRIVSRHQGRIWVESEPGEGAKFVVALPLEIDQALSTSA